MSSMLAGERPLSQAYLRFLQILLLLAERIILFGPCSEGSFCHAHPGVLGGVNTSAFALSLGH
jgi:hypothetical protein